MDDCPTDDVDLDHCRIGSLESQTHSQSCDTQDHCRIGSLEIPDWRYLDTVKDHCRIGSLEMTKVSSKEAAVRSLPHRQLRNPASRRPITSIRSLPHRQLRNIIQLSSKSGILITAA